MKIRKRVFAGLAAMACILVVLSACPTTATTEGPGIIDDTTYSITKEDSTRGDFDIDPLEAKSGDTITLTITSVGSLYEFDTWVISGEPEITPVQDAEDDAVYTFTMPARDINVGIEFKLKDDIEPFTITKGLAANGSINVVAEEAAGEQISVTLTPDTDYRYKAGSFVVLNAAGSDITASLAIGFTDFDDFIIASFIMPETNITVRAEFELIPVQLDVYTLYSGGVLNCKPGVWFDDRYPDMPDMEFLTIDGGGFDGEDHNVLQFGPALGMYGGGLVLETNTDEDGEPISLNEVDALSFWIKASAPMVIEYFSFANDVSMGIVGSDYQVVYQGEDNSGFALSTEWQNVIIPLPKRRNALVDQHFAMWVVKQYDGTTVYIDEIRYIQTDVVLKEIVLVQPEDISQNEPTPISALTFGMKAVYELEGKTVSLFNGNVKFDKFYDILYEAEVGASVSGENLVPSGNTGDDFSFSVTFDGTITGEIEGLIGGRKLTLEDCMTNVSEIIEWAPTNAKGYNSNGCWYTTFTTSDNQVCISFLNKRDVGAGWGSEGGLTRTLDATTSPASWDLTGYTKLSLMLRAGDFKVVAGETDTAPVPVQIAVSIAQGGVFRGARTTSQITIPAADANTWQTYEIPLTSAGFNGLTTDLSNITGWEVWAMQLPELCTVYIGPIVALE